MRRPKAVCFDMGYTLLRHSPSGPDLYLRILADAGLVVTQEAVEAALGPAREHYVAATRAGRDFEATMEAAIEFWTEYNEIVLLAIGVADDRRRALGELIYTTAWSPQSWELFPEVLPALDRLRAMGVRMAVISNFVDTLGAVCELHGLAPYFDDIVASVDARAMKPDPRIFARTVRHLGVEPGEAWHVGDNYWTDVLGSRAAGLRPVLVDRDRIAPSVDCIRVEGIDQLVDLVEQAEPEHAPGDGEVAA